MKPVKYFLVSLLLSVGSLNAAQQQSADFVVLNTKVCIGDSDGSEPEAIAIAGNQIVFVGDSEVAKRYIDQKTRVIDGAGKMVFEQSF